MANKTLREIIGGKLAEIRDIDSVGTARASEILVELSSLLASLGKECSDRKYWLALRKIEMLKEYKSAAKAVIYAEGSDEFRQWAEAEEYRKATIEMIRSIKYYLRTSEIEKKESIY